MAPSHTPTKKPSIALASYTAGLVDGEGSIQINPNKGGSGKKYWGLTIQISSVGVGFLEAIRDRWSVGTITYWKSRGSRPGRRIANWRVYSAQAGWFLSMLLPYLVLKKKQAKIALEFRKCVSPKRDSLTPQLLERRRRLAEALRDANARTGKAKASPVGWGKGSF